MVGPSVGRDPGHEPPVGFVWPEPQHGPTRGSLVGGEPPRDAAHRDQHDAHACEEEEEEEKVSVTLTRNTWLVI